MSKTYLSADELGITKIEREAMIATIDVLRSEQITFNMAVPYSADGGRHLTKTQPACGTNLCIGGAMSLLMQNGMKIPADVTPEMAERCNEFVMSHDGLDDALEPLFFDTIDSDLMPSEGIAAIERFLTGHTHDPWKMGKPEV